ncbi:MAG: hypothetical protein LBQ94_06255 [Treponema sp.]|jgi:hypothetical protein|nr:hypothetical protein [Treponema sp.]
MTGKGRIYIFVILAVALALAGCSSPTGSIGGKNTGSAAGGLVVTPKQNTFNFGERLLPGHFEVTQNGVPVPISDCSVYIMDPTYVPVQAGGYQLFNSGVKRILVRSNNNLSGECTIFVLDSGSAGGNNSAPGIHIEGPY